MSNTWKELDAEQKKEAPPSTCRYCGEPIYWETLRGGKKRPVNATDFERHVCEKRGAGENPPRKEAEMPTNKGKCPHGEFILTEGCPQCIAERQAREAAKAEETVDRDTESLAENQQGQLELATDEISLQEEPAPELIGTQLAEEAGIVEAEESDELYHAPYNAAYHAPYRLQDGSIVPGVTTVLKVLDKGEQLQDWIWECGRQGLDYREVRDAAGRVGTITHRLIASHLRGETADYQPLAVHPDEADRAERCFLKYLAWEKKNPLTPVMIEERLISELFKFGGTPDLLAEINGEFVLIDFKTSGRIYEDYFCQVAAYRKLLEEQDWPIAHVWILRISPDDDQYEVGIQLDFERDWQIFQHALGIYKLRGCQ